MTEEKTITRDELYGRVWAQPVTKVAKQLGISDVAVSKICKKLKVPKPGLGYWAKKQHGKRVRQIKLPPMSPGGQETYTIKGAVDKNLSPTTELIEQQKEFESREVNKVVVKRVLRNAHPLVKQTKQRHDMYNSRNYHEYHNLPPGLEVSVGDESFGRALRIMDALVKAVEKRGHPVTARKGYGSYTSVEVHGEEITFDIFESSKRIPNPERKTSRHANQYAFVPTGKLSLRIKNYYPGQSVISDGKVKKIEDRLNEFIILLVKISENEKIRRQEKEEWEKEYQARAEKERVEARVRQMETERVDRLFEGAQTWHNCELTRKFISAVEAMNSSENGLAWVNWAKAQVEQIESQIMRHQTGPFSD
ncbi:MAG: hypothetical protein K9N38_05810 [Candidatus Marinimicrobia bacterium]|nr:hypothetical protein [Candidatus Neomarinimicrobiota bacterium]